MHDWWKVSVVYNPEFARRQRRDAAAIPAQVWRAIAAQTSTFASLGHDLFWEEPKAISAAMIHFLNKR